jgi:hypothetical protein
MKRYSQALSKTGLKTLRNQTETSGFAVFKIDVLAAFDYISKPSIPHNFAPSVKKQHNLWTVSASTTAGCVDKSVWPLKK